MINMHFKRLFRRLDGFYLKLACHFEKPLGLYVSSSSNREDVGHAMIVNYG